jgi:hypothetical protein
MDAALTASGAASSGCNFDKTPVWSFPLPGNKNTTVSEKVTAQRLHDYP